MRKIHYSCVHELPSPNFKKGLCPRGYVSLTIITQSPYHRLTDKSVTFNGEWYFRSVFFEFNSLTDPKKKNNDNLEPNV